VHTTNASTTISTSLYFKRFGVYTYSILLNNSYWGIYPTAPVTISLNQYSNIMASIEFTANGTSTVYNFTWSPGTPVFAELNGSLTSVDIDAFSGNMLSATFVSSSSTDIEINCTTYGKPAGVTVNGANHTYSYNPTTKLATFTISSGTSQISVNWAPSIDYVVATTKFVDGVYGWVNVTVSEYSGVANLDTVDIQVNTTGDAESFTLRWAQATGLFTEVSDPNFICDLDTVFSTRENVDSDTDIIAFYFAITDATVGTCDVKVTVLNDAGYSDVGTFNNKFLYGVVRIVEKIASFFSTMFQYLDNSVSWATTVLVQTFTFFTSTVGWVLSWFTRMISFFVTLIATVHDIFAGVYSAQAAIGDLWQYISFNTWIDFVPVVLFLSWMYDLDRRWRATGQWLPHFIGDLQMIWWVISVIFDMTLRVIDMSLDYAYRIADLLIPG